MEDFSVLTQPSNLHTEKPFSSSFYYFQLNSLPIPQNSSHAKGIMDPKEEKRELAR